jgi:hypothetical protein
MGLIPAWAINGVVASCLPSGVAVDATGNCNGRPGPGAFVTDGFDNVAKLKRLRRRADADAGGGLATDRQPTAGSLVGVEASSRPPPTALGTGAQGGCGPAPAEVFFFVSTHDDMVPPTFTEALLRARYGGDTDDEETSDEEEDAKIEAHAAAPASVGGWRAWFTRLQAAQPALAAAADSGAEEEGPAAAASPPPASPAPPPFASPRPPGHGWNGPASPDAGAGGARPVTQGDDGGGQGGDGGGGGEAKAALSDKRALDGVIKSMSVFLCRDVLCEDFSSKGSSGSSSSGGGSDERVARRVARQSKRQEVNARLAAARSGRLGVVSGGHGAFFGADRRAAATYEVFLRHIGLLAH